MAENGNGRYTAAQFIDAIPGTGGIITSIAKKVGCTWNTAKKYITNHPTVAQAYSNEENSVLDMAEVEMIKAMQDGELSALKFYLKTKGKKRGYVERQEVSGPDATPVQIAVSSPDELAEALRILGQGGG